VQGRNVRFTSLLTMGECWHNNHHAFPGSARLGLAPGEWDPGWWVLLGLRRLGLVTNLRLPPNLPYRPELTEVRPVGQSKLMSTTGVPSRPGVDAHGFVA
jgi:stearoyl-CoA desaturase (delta-9 desaturase)